MKREIKFRAWDKRTEKWLSNFTVSHDGLIFTLEGVDKLAWQHKNGDLLHLMQFTGLKDKNGKEIYEGDVYKWGDSEKTNSLGDLMSIFHLYKEHVLVPEDIEIIGNIYENPELIKN